MKASFGFAMLLAVGMVVLRPVPASAWLQVCNKTPDSVRVAVATDWYDYYQASVNVYERIADHNVQGWTTVASGACAVPLPGTIYDLNVYVYAYAPSDPSLDWAGTSKRCIDLQRTFNFGESLYDHESALEECGYNYPCGAVPGSPEARGKVSAKPPCASGTVIGMVKLDTGDASNYTDNLNK